MQLADAGVSPCTPIQQENKETYVDSPEEQQWITQKAG